MVLAATNRPWDLDEALRRRLEKRIYIPLPEDQSRKQLFELNLKEIDKEPDLLENTAKMQNLVDLSKGYSGQDITNVCREAQMMGMRKQRDQLKKQRKDGLGGKDLREKFENKLDVPVTHDDLSEAFKNVNRSVGGDDLDAFSAWMKEFGST